MTGNIDLMADAVDGHAIGPPQISTAAQCASGGPAVGLQRCVEKQPGRIAPRD